MTKTPETYSGLNLVAIQSMETGDWLAEKASAEVHAVQTEASRTEGIQPSQAHEPAKAEQTQPEITLPPPSEASMQDYYHLQQNLLGLTIVFTALIFPFVWGFYSLQIALDYILGACAGIVYLKMLGKNVSTLGRQQKNSSAGRLAIFAGVMIVALRWEQVEVLPVFLGFLTYKAAIIVFVLWTSLRPTSVRS